MRKATGFCLHCGVKNKTLFCSTLCRKRDENARNSGPKEPRACFNCDNEIGVECPRHKKFCSEQCRIRFHSKNPEWLARRVQYYRNQRAKRSLAEGSFTRQEWLNLLDFYGRVCLACGTDEEISADHVVPLAKGGLNTIDNIQPLCRMCNSKKHTKIIDYR